MNLIRGQDGETMDQKVHLTGGPFDGYSFIASAYPVKGCTIAVRFKHFSTSLQAELCTRVYGRKLTKQMEHDGTIAVPVTSVCVYVFDGESVCTDGHPVFNFVPGGEDHVDITGALGVDFGDLP